MSVLDPQTAEPPAFFRTRGAVLTPEDLTLADWPQRAHDAGLTTIALHPTPGKVTAFVESDAGQRFLATSTNLGLAVEYELHAMGELLPRALFDEAPRMFRMNDDGERVPDANLCVHSERALDIAAGNAARFAETLRPTTSRYFYWGDDGLPWCRCPKCKPFTESEQALILENRLLSALREVDPRAQLAHLAYLNTLPAPEHVKPAPGVFLEFAPIRRSFKASIADASIHENRTHLDHLDANLAVFGAESAQVLEYWLDCSLFSQWKEPHVKIPWSTAVTEADLDAYGARGIRHITTFAVYVDQDYLERHGEPPIRAYGHALSQWNPEAHRRA
jgi:Domain of unknown function (DUF4838)